MDYTRPRRTLQGDRPQVCCPHLRIPQGRGSVRGKPLRVSPLAFSHPPAGDRFCEAKSPYPAPKEKTPFGVFSFVIAHRFCCVCNQQYVIDTQGYFSWRSLKISCIGTACSHSFCGRDWCPCEFRIGFLGKAPQFLAWVPLYSRSAWHMVEQALGHNPLGPWENMNFPQKSV